MVTEMRDGGGSGRGRVTWWIRVCGGGCEFGGKMELVKLGGFEM